MKTGTVHDKQFTLARDKCMPKQNYQPPQQMTLRQSRVKAIRLSIRANYLSHTVLPDMPLRLLCLLVGLQGMPLRLLLMKLAVLHLLIAFSHLPLRLLPMKLVKVTPVPRRISPCVPLGSEAASNASSLPRYTYAPVFIRPGTRFGGMFRGTTSAPGTGFRSERRWSRRRRGWRGRGLSAPIRCARSGFSVAGLESERGRRRG
jgi:hypothetical protein